ncbi:unnamed protein product [Callosobruchus maculatus]|uniref:Uncharacterized protein n=1 Tax=Callosobruchus maculatus TaxID=64391 RepID=A0A653CR83_CALMS|nr:unnamed protein product [Callosobruchus maculatus]
MTSCYRCRAFVSIFFRYSNSYDTFPSVTLYVVYNHCIKFFRQSNFT